MCLQQCGVRSILSCSISGWKFETMVVSDLGVYPFGFIMNLTPEHPIEYGASIMSLFETEYGKGYKMQWGLMYLERTSDTLPMPLQFKALPKDKNRRT